MPGTGNVFSRGTKSFQQNMLGHGIFFIESVGVPFLLISVIFRRKILYIYITSFINKNTFKNIFI